MFKEVARILQEHDIPYFIHYGSAIGTLRHDGFIPWDDDIDMVIWERDLQKTNEVLIKELDSERFFYHVPSADTHPHVVFKTPDFENDLKEKRAPFIDIFIMESYPETRGRRILVNSMVWMSVISLYVLDHLNSVTFHKAFSWVPRWFENRAKNLTDENSEYCTVYSTTFKDEIFPKSYFEETFMHKFEDTEVPLPVGIDKALTHLFGDYMTPPPEDQRHGANGYPCSIYNDYQLFLKLQSSDKS